MLRDAGFEAVCVDEKKGSREFIQHWLPGSGAEKYVVSANVTATKPGEGGAVGGEGSTVTSTRAAARAAAIARAEAVKKC